MTAGTGTGTGEGVCSTCFFWNSTIIRYAAGDAFVADDRAYSFCARGGFGDSVFTVTYHDGRVVDRACLWSNGIVPAECREQMPDNATLFDRRPCLRHRALAVVPREVMNAG